METFSLDISKFCQRTDTNIKLTIQKIAMEIFKKVILRSPVDTGRFRANWGVSVGSPWAGTVIIVDRDGTATIEAATGKVQGWNCVGSIFLCNNLPYGPALEYGLYPKNPQVGTVEKGHHGMGTINTVGGFSQQAAAGMVRITMAEVDTWVDAVKVP